MCATLLPERRPLKKRRSDQNENRDPGVGELQEVRWREGRSGLGRVALISLHRLSTFCGVFVSLLGPEESSTRVWSEVAEEER